MADTVLTPMFPLTLLPIPGELVPLHIFEPRYRELLKEAETYDISFGIYFSHEINKAKIGSLMKLESILKRYPNGESDIVVKCIDVFYLDVLYRKFKNKPYPGGDITQWNMELNHFASINTYELLAKYRSLRNLNQSYSSLTIFELANEVSLDLTDRYKFLIAPPERREHILHNRLRFLIHSLELELKSKDVYHLN